jgi:hypothetical protein
MYVTDLLLWGKPTKRIWSAPTAGETAQGEMEFTAWGSLFFFPSPYRNRNDQDEKWQWKCRKKRREGAGGGREEGTVKKEQGTFIKYR